MKDLSKIYYLDKNPESKRNTPFDTNFYILHIKGVGTSVTQELGFYEYGKWFLKNSLRQVHPYGYSHIVKWKPEIGAPEDDGQEVFPEVPGFEGTMDALNELTIMGKDSNG